MIRYERHSNEIAEVGALGRAVVAADTVWSGRTWREVRAQIERERPDVAHVTNTFPLISPSAIEACHEAGVPVVHSLHNYRLLCPAANLMRAGRACEECIDHSLLRGVIHGCYRGSRTATAVAATTLAVCWISTGASADSPRPPIGTEPATADLARRPARRGAQLFRDIPHARRIIEAGRRDYNDVRPPSALGNLPPKQFAERAE